MADEIIIKLEPVEGGTCNRAEVKTELCDTYDDVKVPIEMENLFKNQPHNIHGDEFSVYVKNEPADVDVVFSSEVANESELTAEVLPSATNTIKQEIEIEPTKLQASDIKFMPRVHKSEPSEDSLLRARCTQKEFKTVYIKSQSFEGNQSASESDDSSADKTKRKKDLKYQCDICSKTFALKRAVKTHIISIHINIRPHSCNICSKKFRQSAKLKQHMLTHTGEKPHRCDICQKKFSRTGDLRRHVFTHTGTRPHSCDICKKKFIQKGNLNHHMKRHTGEKPHCCDNCPKKFFRVRDLRRHLLTHTGSRPHSCDICQKSFYQRTHLDAHMLIHTGERPHSCSICQKAYKQKRTLNRHILTHTEEKQYFCNICYRKFSRRNYLMGHLKAHTGDHPNARFAKKPIY